MLCWSSCVSAFMDGPHRRMEEWMDISIEEGVKFFLTSLGKPDAIVKKAEAHGIKARRTLEPKVQRCTGGRSLKTCVPVG